MHMRVIESCIKANSFPVKSGMTIFNFKVYSPLTQQSFVPYTYMVYSHNICKWEAGSRGGTYFKIENGDEPIFSSPEPLGSQGELIVYQSSLCPSVVRPSIVRPSSIFKDLLL